MEIDSVSDIRLAGRAISEAWPVTSDVREEVVDKLIGILAGPDEKMSVAAARVLLAADALNVRKRMAEERLVQAEHERKRQLIEYAIKLGLTGDVGDGNRVIDSTPSEVRPG